MKGVRKSVPVLGSALEALAGLVLAPYVFGAGTLASPGIQSGSSCLGESIAIDMSGSNLVNLCLVLASSFAMFSAGSFEEQS